MSNDILNFCISRSLLQEIRQLKAEHAETVQNAQQIGCDQNLLTELRVLRQRKDELEMRMSALQETRRELMVQLEGLMKLLKVSILITCLDFAVTFAILNMYPNLNVKQLADTQF